ncbi:hypothetical protein GYA49_04895 [Candidatus Beckwithbacteria bacterium]|nr:hypothetical protein [Candidatus Beckwithbacteria bacterium]
MNIFKYIVIVALLTIFFTNQVFAITNPQDISNNRFGVHIFDADELEEAAKLVNSNGGSWGYVTVPIRSDDRDREKWNDFMHKAKNLKIIPIIRLATTMEGGGWSHPTFFDQIDFANFLNDLDWPTQNRYVVIYNETNHATEWGGQVNPGDYADVLSSTIETFKKRNQNFFVMAAGLDMAAPTDGQHMNWKTYLYRMYLSQPQVFKKLDGWASHSYPNPGFSGKPTDNHESSINSFNYELDFIKTLGAPNLPVFITETGWSNEKLSDQVVADYLKGAFLTTWDKKEIITVTPFTLFAGDGPFAPFSLLDKDKKPKPQYQALFDIKKSAGQPKLATSNQAKKTTTKVLGESSYVPPESPSSDFQEQFKAELHRLFGF